MWEELLQNITQTSIRYRQTLHQKPVGVVSSHDELIVQANTILPDEGETPEIAIRTLIESVTNGLVHSASPRYFGFVIGGSTPVSVAADWLTSTWNQNAQVYATSPAASIIEEIVTHWILDLLRLPEDCGVGLLTGTQMAHFTALSVARNVVLKQHGWDVDGDGLQGAPHVNIVCGACCHSTIHSAVRLMGLGTRNILSVAADKEGRMQLDAFRQALTTCTGPTIVCVQAGNVNTGAFDPIEEIVAISKRCNAWVHVDGAFGLWAATSPRFRHLVAGMEGADSWATDAHKWLNVPYDSGMVMIRAANVHRELKTARCAYAGPADLTNRDGSQWVPENSRRARGFVLYAALRNFGRKGVQQIVENCCDMAQAFADSLKQLPEVHILNEVVLNQVLCRAEPQGVVDLDAFNAAVALRLQREGDCWIGSTQWQGQTALRISVSNGATGLADVHQSVDCLARAIAEEHLLFCR
jgi:glutamate/tyrosine decarboxylase-like PLP-dependent enzyme